MAQQNVGEELRGLEACDIESLKAKWHALHGADPPKGLSAKLMRRAIGFEIQVRARAGSKPFSRRQLQKVLSARAGNTGKCIAPGSRLIREWHGAVYVVDIVKDGVIWDQKSYTSLSAVAREITGTRWNGRKFFGVDDQASAS